VPEKIARDIYPSPGDKSEINPMILLSETITKPYQLDAVKQKFITQRDIGWIYSTRCLAKSQNKYMFIILLKKYYLIFK
jgi:hypothetical protein